MLTRYIDPFQITDESRLNNFERPQQNVSSKENTDFFIYFEKH